jgi:hypothetical protein
MARSRYDSKRRFGRARPGDRPDGVATPVPYDYGAQFALSGNPGNVVEAAIAFAPDGIFIAVAIGYGLTEERDRDLALSLNVATAAGDLTVDKIPVEALIDGFRIRPGADDLIFTPGLPGEPQFSDTAIAPVQLDRLLTRLKPPSELSFLFSIVDTATGRELQDEPTHNLASLGIATGDRPFRRLANPISFLPRSTVRLQVIEQTRDARGTLFIVFYGYRVPVEAGCPEPVVRILAPPLRSSPPPPNPPRRRVVPFDYVATIELDGRANGLAQSEIVVNTDGEYLATAVGYGISVEEPAVQLATAANQLFVDLAKLRLRDFPPLALRDGVRIRTDLVRLAFQANGTLANNLPVGLLQRLFERLNRPQDFSFTYSIFDSGRGHDLQNIELNNIAGLGTATGKRPFKSLAVPLRLLPRTTLRLNVRSLFGRGRLFFAFQGYKVLGAATGGSR